MLNRIFDYLFLLEGLNNYISSVIQIILLIFWIFIIRVSKVKYKTSLGLSLCLIAVSMIGQIFNIIPLAKTAGEYAFIFLGVGILQIVFTKNDDS